MVSVADWDARVGLCGTFSGQRPGIIDGRQTCVRVLQQHGVAAWKSLGQRPAPLEQRHALGQLLEAPIIVAPD